MKQHFLYWLLLIALISCQQKKIYSCDEIELDRDTYRVGKTQIPVTGTMICYNKDGKKTLEEDFLNGLEHGRRMEWDDKGNMLSDCNFKYGKKDGKQIYYYDNGKIHEVYFFRLDREDSTYTEYYPDGKLKSQGSYTFNDSDLLLRLKVTDDTIPDKDSSGKEIGIMIRRSLFYKPKNGYWYFWDEKGNKSVEKYDNGKFLYRMDSIAPCIWIDQSQVGGNFKEFKPFIPDTGKKTVR